MVPPRAYATPVKVVPKSIPRTNPEADSTDVSESFLGSSVFKPVLVDFDLNLNMTSDEICQARPQSMDETPKAQQRVCMVTNSKAEDQAGRVNM